MSTEDEDDLFSSDDAGEHNAWNMSLDFVAQGSPGTLVESLL